MIIIRIVDRVIDLADRVLDLAIDLRTREPRCRTCRMQRSRCWCGFGG